MPSGHQTQLAGKSRNGTEGFNPPTPADGRGSAPEKNGLGTPGWACCEAAILSSAGFMEDLLSGQKATCWACSSFLVGSVGNVRQWGLSPAGRVRLEIRWCFGVKKARVTEPLWS